MAGIKRGYAGTIRMMWWMAGLVAAIYVSMLFVGRDHGQVREGLAGQAPRAAPESPEAAAAPEPAAAAAPAPAPAPVQEVAAEPAPDAPTLQATASASLGAPQTAAEAGVTLAPEELLRPGETLGATMVVTARGAVVREGPGIQYRLVGRLTKDAEVQLVEQPQQLVGWSVVQFTDGNGVRKQGFVASKLLGKKRN